MVLSLCSLAVALVTCLCCSNMCLTDFVLLHVMMEIVHNQLDLLLLFRVICRCFFGVMETL